MLLRHIEPQNGGARFLLQFEGAELSCGAQEILTFHLAPNSELDELQYARLCDACALFAVKAKAAALVSAKAMSSGELIEKLLVRGASREHAQAAAAHLAELGVLNDLDYAHSVVRHYAAKGYGAQRIAQELYRHRIPKELWEEALTELQTQRMTPETLIEKKLRGGPLTKENVKSLSTYLLRRGYAWEEVCRALNRYSETRED